MRNLKASALAAVILIASACGLGTATAASNESTAHARANATLFAIAMGDAGAELLRIDVEKEPSRSSDPPASLHSRSPWRSSRVGEPLSRSRTHRIQRWHISPGSTWRPVPRR